MTDIHKKQWENVYYCFYNRRCVCRVSEYACTCKCLLMSIELWWKWCFSCSIILKQITVVKHTNVLSRLHLYTHRVKHTFEHYQKHKHKMEYKKTSIIITVFKILHQFHCKIFKREKKNKMISLVNRINVALILAVGN